MREQGCHAIGAGGSHDASHADLLPTEVATTEQ